jgi:hypothetical protein
VGPRDTRSAPGDGLRRAFCDDAASRVAPAGAEVHDPVRALHDVQVVLDDDDGVSRFDEAREHVQ